MKKLISIVIALAVCGGALAQPESVKECGAPIKRKGLQQSNGVATTSLRVHYTFCSEKIDESRTYID